MMNLFKQYNTLIRSSFIIVIISSFFACSSLEKNQKNKNKDLKIIGKPVLENCLAGYTISIISPFSNKTLVIKEDGQFLEKSN